MGRGSFFWVDLSQLDTTKSTRKSLGSHSEFTNPLVSWWTIPMFLQIESLVFFCSCQNSSSFGMWFWPHSTVFQLKFKLKRPCCWPNSSFFSFFCLLKRSFDRLVNLFDALLQDLGLPRWADAALCERLGLWYRGCGGFNQRMRNHGIFDI